MAITAIAMNASEGTIGTLTVLVAKHGPVAFGFEAALRWPLVDLLHGRRFKTDRRDTERIVREDMLQYLRRCYIPSTSIEETRFVFQQIQIERKIGRVKNQVHALLERNMIHDLDGFSDIFSVHGLRRMVEIQLPAQEKAALARYLEELKLLTAHHRQLETELARLAESDRDALLLMSIPGIDFFTALDCSSRP